MANEPKNGDDEKPEAQEALQPQAGGSAAMSDLAQDHAAGGDARGTPPAVTNAPGVGKEEAAAPEPPPPPTPPGGDNVGRKVIKGPFPTRSSEADDPFDFDRLRLPQNFAETSVRKAIVSVPVRKADRQTFIRVHPDPAWQSAAAAGLMAEDYCADR